MTKLKIKYLFCESFTFEKGIWLGKFQFCAEIEHIPHIGFLYSVYKQSTPSPSIKKRYSFGKSFSKLSSSDIKEIKKEVNIKFEELFANLTNIFIVPRELNMPQPSVTNIEFDKSKSTDNYWFFSFQLTNFPTSTFHIEMELFNNTWHYSIISDNGNIYDYKNSLQWEDSIVEAIIEKIKLVPEIRYKFLYQKVKYKFKNKRR